MFQNTMTPVSPEALENQFCLEPTPSSPVRNPTNSSQSDALQVKSPILEKYT